jgi:hypothetical protein
VFFFQYLISLPGFALAIRQHYHDSVISAWQDNTWFIRLRGEFLLSLIALYLKFAIQ